MVAVPEYRAGAAVSEKGKVPLLSYPELATFIQRVLPSASTSGALWTFPPVAVAWEEMKDFCFPDGDYDEADWEPEAIGRHVHARLTEAEFQALLWLTRLLEKMP